MIPIHATQDGPRTIRAATPLMIGGTKSRADGDTHVLTFTAKAGATYTVQPQPNP